MTSREEFDERRQHGLRRRNAQRLLNATTPPCGGCGGSLAGCETRRWLSGKDCCTDCSHTMEDAE